MNIDDYYNSLKKNLKKTKSGYDKIQNALTSNYKKLQSGYATLTGQTYKDTGISTGKFVENAITKTISNKVSSKKATQNANAIAYEIRMLQNDLLNYAKILKNKASAKGKSLMISNDVKNLLGNQTWYEIRMKFNKGKQLINKYMYEYNKIANTKINIQIAMKKMDPSNIIYPNIFSKTYYLYKFAFKEE